MAKNRSSNKFNNKSKKDKRSIARHFGGKTQSNKEDASKAFGKKARSPDEDPFFCFSLKDKDRTQGAGQHYEDWAEAGLLCRMLERLDGLCKMKINELQSGADQNFTQYPHFPPAKKTDFNYPQHISEDADWTSIRFGGKERMIGHMVDNVFHLVFLDKDHKFWKSSKKHT